MGKKTKEEETLEEEEERVEVEVKELQVDNKEDIVELKAKKAKQEVVMEKEKARSV